MKNTILKLTLLFLTAMSVNIFAQTSFFEPTDYVGALSSDPAKDWTKDWTNFDPFNTVYPVVTNNSLLDATTEVTGRKEIPNNTTLDGIYLLKGVNYVADGSTLVIKPGTIIRAESDVSNSNFACLIINRGAKIMAEGTKMSPIVFTSNKEVGSKARGDWAGVFIAGRAPMNQTQTISGVVVSQRRMEGFDVRSQFDGLGFYGAGEGTIDAMDNSGVLKYVRIEFAGQDLNTNQELNSLTLGAVGAGTTIDYVQTSYGNDDAIEWFGGTVNAKHLISLGTTDDDFDTDFGFTGYVQFAIAIKDKRFYDGTYNAPSGASTSEGFESDNDGNGTGATPYTAAIFSNVSMFGPVAQGTSYADLSSIEKAAFRRGARIRRNSRLTIINSVFQGYRNYVMIDGSASINAAGVTAPSYEGGLQIKNNLFVDVDKSQSAISVTTATSGLAEVASTGSVDVSILQNWLLASENSNRTVSGAVFLNPLITAASVSGQGAIDFKPLDGSAALTGSSFTLSKLSGLVSTVVSGSPVVSAASFQSSSDILSNVKNMPYVITVSAMNLTSQDIIIEIPSSATGFVVSPNNVDYEQNWTISGVARLISDAGTIAGIPLSFSNPITVYDLPETVLYVKYITTSTSALNTSLKLSSENDSKSVQLTSQITRFVPAVVSASEEILAIPNSISNLTTTALVTTITASNLRQSIITISISSTADGFGFSTSAEGTYSKNWTVNGVARLIPNVGPEEDVDGAALVYEPGITVYDLPQTEIFAKYTGTLVSSIVTFATISSGATSIQVSLSNQEAPIVLLNPSITFSGARLTVGGVSLNLSDIFLTNSSGQVSYSILGEAASLSGSSLIPVSVGSVTVTGTVSTASGFNSGTATAIFNIVSFPTSYYGLLENSSVNIYPNPTYNGEFTIELGAESAATINIFDYTGSLIRDEYFIGKSLVVNGISAGFYMVKISSNNSVKTVKLVVK